MREKHSYLPRVVAGAKITGKTADKKNYIVEHQPCPKFRVIVPLAGHWRAKDFENQLAANASWRQFIAALASLLGLQHDQSCTDTSRLFFFPRTRQGGPEYEFRQVAGNACCMEQVLSQAPETEPRFRRANEHDNNADNGLGRISREWAAKNAPGFEIATALQARSPQVLLRQNGVKQTITCPFESYHSSPGGEGTFVVNASQFEGSRPRRTQIWVCRKVLSQCLRGTRPFGFAARNAG